jgi:hypothetical protein
MVPSAQRALRAGIPVAIARRTDTLPVYVCLVKVAARTARERGDNAASPTVRSAKACQHFATAKGCPYGHECKFAHKGAGLFSVTDGENGRPGVNGGVPSRHGGAPVSGTPRRY